MINTTKNETNRINLFKPKPFLLNTTKYLFKDYNSLNNKKMNQKIINRINFLTNKKSSNSKINNDEKGIYSNKTIYIPNMNFLPFKKENRIQSLKDNSIWNDYIETENNKKLEQLKNKRNVKQEILTMLKLFKEYYFNKNKNKNKINMNNKEKYLNFLDEHSLNLRENIIKNHLRVDRGGKQKLRKIYNPLNAL